MREVEGLEIPEPQTPPLFKGLAVSADSDRSKEILNDVCERLREGKPLRRTLAGWGRLHIDRQLPFMIVYRQPPEDEESDRHAPRLASGEASYLLAPGGRGQLREVASLVKRVASTLCDSFGSFLIIELWTEREPAEQTTERIDSPSFRILASSSGKAASTVDVLEASLREIKIKGEFAQVERVSVSKVAPKGLPELISSKEANRNSWYVIGIEVRPVYRKGKTGEAFPLVWRTLHKGLSLSIKRAVFEFTKRRTTHRPRNYQALGRRSVVKAVWEVDRALAEISDSFDFLLQVTPTNTEAAWRAFKRNRFEGEPEFLTRPMGVDPALMKRRLYHVPIERIEDPTLEDLFREQQVQLDRKLTMLDDRGSERFLYGSLQLYGSVDESLLNMAYGILNQMSARSREGASTAVVNAASFAKKARAEIAAYDWGDTQTIPGVDVRPDVAGIMVSRGRLLVGKDASVPAQRVDALIQHEVGTHIVTYSNGRAQPFRQLYVGLAGYEELQEGLAVLAEYLVGGLTRPRLRLLAARVVAVRRLLDGAQFADVFRELCRSYGFAQRTAFTIAMRVFRGGGLTKDVAYLRGLAGVLDYLREGGELEPLWVGKIGPQHVSIIRELQWRKVLRSPPLRPRYLERQEAREKLVHLSNGVTVSDLI